MAVSQAEPVDAQSRPFRSLTVILTLGVMARFPPGCLDRSRTAIGRGLAPALNRSGSHDPNQVSPIVMTRRWPGSSKQARQGLDETWRECEDGTTDFAIGASKRSIMESSSARNLDDLRARVAEACAELGARAAGYWQ